MAAVERELEEIQRGSIRNGGDEDLAKKSEKRDENQEKRDDIIENCVNEAKQNSVEDETPGIKRTSLESHSLDESPPKRQKTSQDENHSSEESPFKRQKKSQDEPGVEGMEEENNEDIAQNLPDNAREAKEAGEPGDNVSADQADQVASLGLVTPPNSPTLVDSTMRDSQTRPRLHKI